ncbi:chrB protein [Pseudohongiella nitratireducens]|uniref:ChrB protein n=1 Tax=Pseudohongiella nitratireducens TaxID=1768907 RepID=A0A917LSX3_9GAMM|nr:chromate resistance protein ChrB domain-containing protein [Pseudohongiella nitratireducens]GGG55988.1 chrB protein [Pseudohongiella nitratireducens]
MSEKISENQAANREKWLLLIFQLPSKPAYLRVKVWRRLQGIGAIAVKNSVYALPANEESLEDYEWLLREIEEGSGEGMICETQFVDGLTDAQVRQLFDQARDADYDAVATEARALDEAIKNDKEQETEDVRNQIVRLRKKLIEIEAVDFFGANGREAAEGLLSALEDNLKNATEKVDNEVKKTASSAIPQGSVWVTRKGVHVDRIASAWLIRRFIDPEMQLKFVAATGYIPEDGELRFDMFEAEFTHEGDNCTFEVLLSRAGIDVPALQAIAEIVHDIDIKDGKFAREEVAGIRTLITSICLSTSDDDERIRRGSVVFADLYRYFKRKGLQ